MTPVIKVYIIMIYILIILAFKLYLWARKSGFYLINVFDLFINLRNIYTYNNIYFLLSTINVILNPECFMWIFLFNIFNKCAKYASQEMKMRWKGLNNHKSMELVSRGDSYQTPNFWLRTKCTSSLYFKRPEYKYNNEGT